MDYKDSLIGFYENGEHALMHEVLDSYLVTPDPIPLPEFMKILEETGSQLLQKKIIGVLMARAGEMMRELIDAYQKSTSRRIKAVLMHIIFSDITEDNSMFLIDQYVRFPKFRDDLFGVFRKEPETVFLAMANYVELHSLTAKQASTITEFLAEIDPNIFKKYAGMLSYHQISDYYYAIPPQNRL